MQGGARRVTNSHYPLCPTLPHPVTLVWWVSDPPAVEVPTLFRRAYGTGVNFGIFVYPGLTARAHEERDLRSLSP